MKRYRLRHQSRQTIKTRLPNVKPFIWAGGQRADFVRTDIEDSLGRWSGSDLLTKDGYWILHEGKRHHIYYANPKDRW